MAGCDGRAKSRNYYTDFALGLPKDTVILTAGSIFVAVLWWYYTVCSHKYWTIEAFKFFFLFPPSISVVGMALLDSANTGTYGHPEITKVNIGVRNNPGILVSGHDLKDLGRSTFFSLFYYF